jgi:hypothetical protein
MTDEQTAAVMPHAVRLAAAVAHRDPDAAAVAYAAALSAPQTGDADEDVAVVIYCLADLVTSAEAATIRVEVRTHPDTAATLAALSARGLLP